MSGYDRTGQPVAFSRASVIGAVTRFIGERDIAQVLREQDPFLCDDPCPRNAGGPHNPIICANDMVCEHCSKVFWPFCAKVINR